jgi:oligoribonuclease NrnB/cAMP/cGMP phosphodiesterase (DHH superfamily)
VRARSSSILVLDHHKTAKEALDGLPYAQFDMDRSGAVMAWQHFFSGQPIPDLLLDVQDRDLWKWSRETSKDTTAGLPLLESSMNLWAEAAVDLSYLGEVRAAGNAKNQFDEMLIESRIKHVKEILLEDGKRTKPFKCAVINTTVLGSEMGNELCKVGYDVAILYFLTDEGEVVLSFRSIGDVDVSALAKKLHGGGHKNAAGARVAIPGLGVLYSGRPSLHINELITHAIIPYK